MEAKAEEFLTNCWKVIRAHGREDAPIALRAQVAWGLKAKGATCYRDALVEIVAEAQPSKRILVTKRQTNVPVVCTGSDGEPFRWHGEYKMIAGHIRLLVVDLLRKEEDDEAS